MRPTRSEGGLERSYSKSIIPPFYITKNLPLVAEIKPTSELCIKARKAGEKAGVSGWGVGPVLYGSVAEWVNQGNKGRR